jgi:hypothetical protein
LPAVEVGADVALLIDPSDEPARRTLSTAMAREGWRVADGPPSACAVVVWSERSIASDELAATARRFLDGRRLLQVLWQPESWSLGQHGGFEAPEPFVYHQGLVVGHGDLDGSERAVDWFAFRLSDGEDILAELARLGRLPRPRDGWNARISFHKPDWRIRDVVLVEYAAEDGRVLRRWPEQHRDPVVVYFDTTIGNRWEIRDAAGHDVIDEIVVDDDEVYRLLPQRRWWWARG